MEIAICRLLGFTSRNSTTFNEVVGPSFDSFVKLANDHCDGWGIATPTDLYREPTAATKSTHFTEEIARRKSTGALLHFRWATPGLAIDLENTHPFIREGISFIHNGALLPGNQLDSKISPDLLASIQGTTDSERFFLYLVTEIRKHGFLSGVVQGLQYMKDNINFSSINCMVMNGDFFVAACIYNIDRIPEHFKDQLDYYSLKFTQNDGEVIVASSGWDQSEWHEIPNNSVLIVNRATQEYKMQSLS